ncbi:hypothetical protein [Fusibacillus kribbianus]|uniref:Uncharacterized protein n=1 Tax=Fusibacillus kribbianus TaxID=3044208 RepID=A0AAP4BBQ3_9FIRM|nr:hypothetical protein [Ruminococcus sp. YH-rum2234]MDI9242715.1 hypothetical protein [Ruminococcus sp. YH-rum2234]
MRKAKACDTLSESRWLVGTGRGAGPSTFVAVGDESNGRWPLSHHKRGRILSGNMGGNAETFRP